MVLDASLGNVHGFPQWPFRDLFVGPSDEFVFARIPRMSHFSPHLEILPPPQRTLWSELSDVPREFVLYGGTALALHLGHRNSVDFDFFGSRALDLSQIEQGISFLK